MQVQHSLTEPWLAHCFNVGDNAGVVGTLFATAKCKSSQQNDKQPERKESKFIKTATFTVPCTLGQLLRPQFRPVFTPLLERLVRLQHALSIQASLLAKDWVLCRLESGVPQPFGNLDSFDQTFFNRCKALISTPTERARVPKRSVLPAGLLEARNQHVQHCRPEGFVPTQRPGYASQARFAPFFSTDRTEL